MPKRSKRDREEEKEEESQSNECPYTKAAI